MPGSEKPDAIAEIEENIRQALADLESQREWIAKGGRPDAHIKGRSEQATYELNAALSLLPRLREVVEAAKKARDEAGTHTIPRDRPLDSGFGRIWGALDGPLAALEGGPDGA